MCIAVKSAVSLKTKHEYIGRKIKMGLRNLKTNGFALKSSVKMSLKQSVVKYFSKTSNTYLLNVLSPWIRIRVGVVKEVSQKCRFAYTRIANDQHVECIVAENKQINWMWNLKNRNLLFLICHRESKMQRKRFDKRKVNWQQKEGSEQNGQMKKNCCAKKNAWELFDSFVSFVINWMFINSSWTVTHEF